MSRRELFTYLTGLIVGYFSFCMFGRSRPSVEETLKQVLDKHKLFYHRGGMVPKNSDSIPSLLSHGEYYISKKAYEKYGKEFFDSLNK